MDIEELKRWTTDRLDYEDNEIGKEHSEYRGHYYAGVLAIVAKLEAAQRLRDEVSRIASITPHQQTKEVLDFAIAAFDKEQQ